MKFLKFVFLILLFPLITGSTVHKFYVSTTKIEHVADSESLQIITHIFIDDIEDVLQERYIPSITLGPENETPNDAVFLKKYILQKFKININGTELKLDYLGHEYEMDIVKSYIEVIGIKDIEEIEIENKILMDLFDDQQNIIHFKTEKNRKSLILNIDNPKGVLNFN